MRRRPSEQELNPDGDDSGKPRPKTSKPAPGKISPKALRIIGGELRRRNVLYNGDRATRPMKDSVRENLFNILGKTLQGAVAWDLFAGTGIVAIEAISRGAVHAVAIDASRDCIRSIRKSSEALNLGDRLEILLGDTFRIATTRFQFAENERRVVFCCPPYAMWESQNPRLVALLENAIKTAAPGSFIVVETDRKFDPTTLFEADWDIRGYGNTNIGVVEVGAEMAATPAE